MSIVGIGRVANLATIWKILIEYDDGAVLLTKCGLEAVDRVDASAIYVVRSQGADASSNCLFRVRCEGTHV